MMQSPTDRSGLRTRRLTMSAMFATLALIFTYVEFLIPYSVGIPGVKLGLANLVIIIALYKMDFKYAMTINLLRIGLSGLLFSGVFAMGPLGYVSLESTGGVLIGSLILGYIGKIGPFSFRMDSKILAIIRELGLAFFLAIVGLNYGYGAIDAITGSGIQLALVSLIVGFIACMVGFLVGRYGFKLNWVILSGALCGGMTSTPGLGAATEAIGSDEPGAGYGATYPFALLGMVIFAIVLHKLPLL